MDFNFLIHDIKNFKNFLKILKNQVDDLHFLVEENSLILKSNDQVDNVFFILKIDNSFFSSFKRTIGLFFCIGLKSLYSCLKNCKKVVRLKIEAEDFVNNIPAYLQVIVDDEYFYRILLNEKVTYLDIIKPNIPSMIIMKSNVLFKTLQNLSFLNNPIIFNVQNSVFQIKSCNDKINYKAIQNVESITDNNINKVFTVYKLNAIIKFLSISSHCILSMHDEELNEFKIIINEFLTITILLP